MPVKDIVKNIRLGFHKRKGVYLNITDVKLIRPNHPANCLTLDLVKIPSLSLKGLTKIEFSFENHPKYKLEVRIEDRFHSLSRAYKYNKFGYSGPKMDLDLSINMFRYFAVKFTQNKMTDKDPRKRCKNYIKTSYNDCDEEFIKTELEINYPPGFLPI